MQNRTLLGISLMIITTFLFSAMDGVSKYLAETNSVLSLVSFRVGLILNSTVLAEDDKLSVKEEDQLVFIKYLVFQLD